MKLKPRFFDGTAFQKDITRFAPIWALYLIGGLMVAQSVMNQYYRDVDFAFYYNARQLSGYIGYFGAINLVYAMLWAQLLHGDLFNSKLCNALHAMPLRRENWFVTHTVSGLLFSLVPNLVMALSIIPYLEGLWFTAFLWLLGMELHFLFFFGLATFTVHCTGNRFASVVVYLLLNVLSVLALWFVDTIYGPLLYGVEFNLDTFLMLCPVVWLLSEPDYFQVTVADAPDGHKINLPQVGPSTYWEGLGDSWGYLTVLAVVGLVLLVLALVLYRKRNLESAGDFVAFKPMKPIFWVVFTLGAGGAMQFIGENMLDVGESGSYVFLALGLICGYFVARMLIARTVKVFGGRNWLQLAVFLGVFLLSIGLTLLDPLGVTRYMPKVDRVQAVYVGDMILSKDLILQGEDSGGMNTKDPQVIDQILRVHEMLIREGSGNDSFMANTHRPTESFHIVYVLESGTTVTRHYTPAANSPACVAAWELIKGQTRVFPQGDAWETFQNEVTRIRFEEDIYIGVEKESLLKALWMDEQAGSLYGRNAYHRYQHEESSLGNLIITMADQGYHIYATIYVTIYPCFQNTTLWLAGKGVVPELEWEYIQKSELAALAPSLELIKHGLGRELTGQAEMKAFLQCLQEDVSAGLAKPKKPLESDWIIVNLHFKIGTPLVIYVAEDSASCAYLQALS